jgi:hypothetical protein
MGCGKSRDVNLRKDASTSSPSAVKTNPNPMWQILASRRGVAPATLPIPSDSRVRLAAQSPPPPSSIPRPPMSPEPTSAVTAGGKDAGDTCRGAGLPARRGVPLLGTPRQGTSPVPHRPAAVPRVTAEPTLADRAYVLAAAKSMRVPGGRDGFPPPPPPQAAVASVIRFPLRRDLSAPIAPGAGLTPGIGVPAVSSMNNDSPHCRAQLSVPSPSPELKSPASARPLCRIAVPRRAPGVGPNSSPSSSHRSAGVDSAHSQGTGIQSRLAVECAGHQATVKPDDAEFRADALHTLSAEEKDTREAIMDLQQQQMYSGLLAALADLAWANGTRLAEAESAARATIVKAASLNAAALASQPASHVVAGRRDATRLAETIRQQAMLMQSEHHARTVKLELAETAERQNLRMRSRNEFPQA